MNNAKHTRGPWRFLKTTVLCGEESDPLIVCHTDGSDPCHVGNGHGEQRQCLANARLIAAAPDLLEALKNLTECVEQWNQDVEKIIGRHPETGSRNALEEARAAINKAEK